MAKKGQICNQPNKWFWLGNPLLLFGLPLLFVVGAVGHNVVYAINEMVGGNLALEILEGALFLLAVPFALVWFVIAIIYTIVKRGRCGSW